VAIDDISSDLDEIELMRFHMLVYLNGQRNMIILPKETLEKLGNPKYSQFLYENKCIILRYSNTIMQMAAVVNYPLKENSYGIHIRDEKVADFLRKRYKWEDFLYAIDAEQFHKALIIEPSIATKTKMPNKEA